jgi:hypothetical protein
MYARNKKTGARIIGTSEVVEATSLILEHSFEMKDGNIVFECEGETKVHWDSQVTKIGEDGGLVFVDENYEDVSETDIELYDEDAESADGNV